MTALDLRQWLGEPCRESQSVNEAAASEAQVDDLLT